LDLSSDFPPRPLDVPSQFLEHLSGDVVAVFGMRHEAINWSILEHGIHPLWSSYKKSPYERQLDGAG
jgi:hypothetical protein